MTPRAKPREGPVRAAVYVRVSTDTQAENGVSLAAQRERLAAFCVARAWNVAGVYVDEGASAKTLRRPAMQQLLQDLKKKPRPFDAVVAYSLSRLTRSVKDLGALLEAFDRKGVAVVSLSESLDATTAAGRLMLNVLGSVSQWEREATGERTREALRHKRARGEVAGEIPYGFARRGDRLVPVPRELEVARRILAMREERRTLREIAGVLMAEGIKTKKGKRQWAPEVVRGIIFRAALYQGETERRQDDGEQGAS